MKPRTFVSPALSSLPEPYVAARDVAAYLKVTPAYVLGLALRGEIPAMTLPTLNGDGKRRTWRFRLSEISAWAREREREGRP